MTLTFSIGFRSVEQSKFFIKYRWNQFYTYIIWIRGVLLCIKIFLKAYGSLLNYDSTSTFKMYVWPVNLNTTWNSLSAYNFIINNLTANETSIIDLSAMSVESNTLFVGEKNCRKIFVYCLPSYVFLWNVFFSSRNAGDLL